MRAIIYYKEQYSRGELLLRAFFGFFYIIIPHAFLLFFVAIWGAILQFLTFWVILLTGRFPESWFQYQEKWQRWNWRFNARLFNMADGYPEFGLDGQDTETVYEVPYHENPDRVSVLLRGLFGWLYVLLPHGFILALLNIIVSIYAFIAWWLVLLTGSYPKSMFDFNLNVQRWSARVTQYMAFMTDQYPPFGFDEPTTAQHMDESADDDDEAGESTYKKEDLV